MFGLLHPFHVFLSYYKEMRGSFSTLLYDYLWETEYSLNALQSFSHRPTTVTLPVMRLCCGGYEPCVSALHLCALEFHSCAPTVVLEKPPPLQRAWSLSVLIALLSSTKPWEHHLILTCSWGVWWEEDKWSSAPHPASCHSQQLHGLALVLTACLLTYIEVCVHKSSGCVVDEILSMHAIRRDVLDTGRNTLSLQTQFESTYTQFNDVHCSKCVINAPFLTLTLGVFYITASTYQKLHIVAPQLYWWRSAGSLVRALQIFWPQWMRAGTTHKMLINFWMSHTGAVLLHSETLHWLAWYRRYHYSSILKLWKAAAAAQYVGSDDTHGRMPTPKM